MKKPRTGLRRLPRWTLLAVLTATISSFFLFSIFELFPGLIQPLRLEGIRYLGMRSRYLPDPELVVVPRRTNFTFRGRTRGDLYRPWLGVEVPWREVEASYNELGFRSNSAGPPYRVMLIGDSYVEGGDNDRDTLSERLRATSGLSAFNLGRGWYGPPQYVELLRRFGPRVRPTYAVFCFFAGNDIEDIRQYDRWRTGASYYDFYRWEAGFLARYRTAMRDTLHFIRARARQGWDRLGLTGGPQPGPAGSRLVEIRLGEETVPLRIRYEREPIIGERPAESRDWRRLRSLLQEFRDLAREQRIRPLVLYIPTKLRVYEPFLVTGDVTTAGLPAPGETLARIAADLDLEVIDLLPVFRRAAAGGDLLYHPYDTHWNGTGRQRAAEHIAARLLELDRQGREGSSR